jgi:MFS family permease
LLQALAGGLQFHSFGAYFVFLQADFGWSRTLISGASSLSGLAAGSFGLVQGWLINRFGPRPVIRLGIVLFGLGFALLSRIEDAPGFYLANFLITLGFGLAGFLTVNIVLANWFQRWRARAMALAAMGGSLAGLLVPVIAWSLQTFGWRATALASAVAALAIGLPVTQMMRGAPEAYGLVPDGARPVPVASTAGAPRFVDARAGLTTGQALRTPAFWLLTGGHGLALVAVSSLAVHLIPYLVNQVHFAIPLAAAMVAVFTVVSVFGQVIGGFFGDRFSKRFIAAGCMAMHTAGVLLLAFGTTLPFVLAFAVLHGLAWGIRGPLMMAVRADYFGRRSFATIEGIASFIVTICAVAGPLIVGITADRLGDYRPSLLFLAFATSCGILCFLFARRPTVAPSPQRAESLS